MRRDATGMMTAVTAMGTGTGTMTVMAIGIGTETMLG